MNAEQSAPVPEQNRGEAIQERLEAIGISDREFQTQTGIDRKTLRRAIDNEPVVRASTFAAIESALDRLERELGKGAVVGDPTGEDLVEFTIEGNFGVRAVVKGPIRDMDQLQAAVRDLLREMKGDSSD